MKALKKNRRSLLRNTRGSENIEKVGLIMLAIASFLIIGTLAQTIYNQFQAGNNAVVAVPMNPL
jgi:hypothetical protein